VLLAVLAFADLMTATTLLALTFALGIWVAMNTPTWQAITAELAGNEGRRSSRTRRDSPLYDSHPARHSRRIELQHRAALGGRAFGVARLNKARQAFSGTTPSSERNIVYLDSDVTLLCVKPDWMIRDFISCTYRGLRRCDSGPAQNFFNLPFSRLAPRGFCRQSGCDG
jgi:Transmembrane secretion effector